MHQAVLDFFEHVRELSPGIFHGKRVLECGSYDINGSVRPLFTDCEYIGIDWRPGPGVDVVSMAHRYKDDNGFDVVVSTEMLEHDPYWYKSVVNMVNLLRPGGDMILSFAGPTRPEHEVDTSPRGGYYMGIDPAEVIDFVQLSFSDYLIHSVGNGNDVYMYLGGKK